MFPHIWHAKVYRAVIWILGEYATSKEEIKAAVDQILAALSEVPLMVANNGSSPNVASIWMVESKRRAGEKSEDGNSQAASAQLVTSDGTYATQSAFSAASARE